VFRTAFSAEREDRSQLAVRWATSDPHRKSTSNMTWRARNGLLGLVARPTHEESEPRLLEFSLLVEADALGARDLPRGCLG
jgi:hypothetical protein